MADCDMKQISKEMGIPRCKLYRWLKGKTHLDEDRQEYIKKLLTGSAFGFIISYATLLNIIAQYSPSDN